MALMTSILAATSAGPPGPQGLLLPGLISTLSATLLMTVVFGYLASRARSRPLWLWAGAWGSASLRRVTEITGLYTGHGLVLDAVFDLSIMVSGLLLLAGTRALYGKRLGLGWWVAGGLAVAMLNVGRSLDGSFLLVHAPPFLFLAIALGFSGWTLLRSRDPKGIGRLIAGWGLVVWAVHVADFPFLRPIADFAPWGFTLAAVLQVAIAVGMLILHFERARAALHASERRSRALFEHSIDGMFRADSDGRFVDVNPALVRLLGAANEKTLKETTRLTDLFPEGAAPISNPRLLAVDPSLRPRHTYLRPDDTRVDIDVTSWTVRGSDGELEWFEGVVRDVTREQAIQTRLLQARKLEAIGQLAGGIAHDFNNLLTVISGCASLLDRAEDEATRAELQADISSAAQRAADLTAKLLTFSRRRVSDSRRVDLVPVISQTASMLHRLIGEDVTLQLDLASEPCVIDADVLLVEQTLLNLAVNARDAMPGGGTLTIGLARQGDTVVLTVADTGGGIPPEALPHIFEPFFTTKDVGEGTGLGLATVYGAVAQLGGEIDVDSQLGRGTRFTMRFPARVPASASESAPGLAVISGRRQRLLLVEDEDGVRRLAARFLRDAGHEVVACGDGEEAWAVFEASPASFDVIVTDVVMPRLSGGGLAARVRAVRADLPIVFVTGYPDRGGVDVEGTTDGALHVEKPFTRESLCEAVSLAVLMGGERDDAAGAAGAASAP